MGRLAGVLRMLRIGRQGTAAQTQVQNPHQKHSHQKAPQEISYRKAAWPVISAPTIRVWMS